jgi:hypothetical protein
MPVFGVSDQAFGDRFKMGADGLMEQGRLSLPAAWEN